MASSDPPGRLVSQAAPAEALMQRLAEQFDRASASAVFGEPVTRDGITVVPVAEVGFGFAGSAGSESVAVGAHAGGGGARARARGYIEIKDGTATYKPLRAPWVHVAVPLAALVAGAVAPVLVRRLAKHRGR